jgi:hypothetical protein
MSDLEPYGVCVECRAWWTRVDGETTTGHREGCSRAGGGKVRTKAA